MEAKWSYRFDRDGHINGFSCIAFDLETINNGHAVGYDSKKGTAFATTKKFQDILGYTVDSTAFSKSAKVNTFMFYVNPSDRDKLLGTQGKWLTTQIYKVDGEIITVKARMIEHEYVHRTELHLIE